MNLPTTYFAALCLMICSMLCWGSWANSFKLTKNWRFELFYFDYALGVLLASLIAGLTVGTLGFDGFSMQDDLLHAGLRQDAWGVVAGVVFNLANMLLVAAISVSGMAVAFPIAIGLALVIGVVWNFALNAQGNALLLFGGVALVVVAIIVDAFAFASYTDSKQLAAKALNPNPRVKRQAPKVQGAALGIILSIVSGILMGMFYPML